MDPTLVGEGVRADDRLVGLNGDARVPARAPPVKSHVAPRGPPLRRRAQRGLSHEVTWGRVGSHVANHLGRVGHMRGHTGATWALAWPPSWTCA
eukprot:4356171-Prymnesium_polylepis.1